MEQETRNITQEEWLVINEDLQALCEKHNIELGVKAQLEILKRVEPVKEDIASPYDSGTTTTETATEATT